MKQQFLDLNGLTELVTYLKKSITEQKEILPYASNKLFPSTGNVNTIYIDTATNSIYRWDSSNKKYEILAKAVKSVSISESTENGKITLTVDGNKTTVPIHGLGSAAYTNSSAYSPAGHTHTKAQVGLGNVDNTADANKSVKHAITANSATTAGTATNVSATQGTDDAARHVWFSDSATETKRAYSDKFKYNPVTNNLTVNVTGNAATASSVAWGNVTGKPSTYAPSAHNHDDSTITSLNASKLFGTIDIARLPHGALERCVIVADDTARFALTTAKIQLGDTVKVNKTQKMYFVIDDSKLNSEAGYTVYTAGSATSVPWSGVTGKPTSYPPSSHTHAYLPLSGGTMTGALNFANGIWNVVGDDVAIGDMNISGTLGVMGKNGNTAIKLVQYGASTTSGSAAPGVTWICTGANASTISGTLSGTFSGNLSGTATSANAAPWSGITGKPSTYPPSSHTHNYAGSSTAGGIAYNANALYKNPSTRQTSANYDLTNDNIYAHRVTYSVASSTMTTAKPPTDAHILTFGWDTNAGYGAQFAVGNSFSNHLYIRGAKSETKDNKNVCTWESSWRTVLDSGNYTSYTVTKTGSGASGTWGINVSGGAAYPTGFNSRVTSATWGNQTGTLITDWHTSNGGDIQFRDNSGQLNVITDGFFYQNEGRNLVLDSSNYSNYAATKGHTHNYAGSASAGGNANAAVKLANARKIGNASFDGTADITLSQMGLNVPVEITKANYLAKKKAGTLNANTYYNVIDEYDSANVINDSSVTANSAFSSTKSEKTYAKKSTLVTTTLTASKWTGSSAPYTYVLPVSGATTSNIVEINYASNASSQAIEAYQNAMLADGGQTTNQITIKATEKPTVDIPITIVIRNDL